MNIRKISRKTKWSRLNKFIDIYFLGDVIVNSLVEICLARHHINITDKNFLKVFNIANNNVKIIRSIKREVDDFKDIRRFFKVWQYRLWSFQGRDTKLERFWAKNQLKLPNFDNWSNGKVSKNWASL